MRAEEVQVGDITWANAAGVLKPHVVTSRGHVTEMGLWAPLTGSGTILVDGVAASVHSDWYLDPIFDAIGRPDLLPAIYQVSFFSVLLQSHNICCCTCLRILRQA